MTVPRIAHPLLLLVCVGLAAGPAVGQLATADTTAQLELDGPSTVTPGETVTTKINVTTTRPLYAAQFELTVNGTALTPAAVDQGGFLARDAQSIVIVDELGARNVSYGETRVGVETGVDGTGTLATVSFSVARGATSETIALELRDVKLVTPAAEPVTTSTRNLTTVVDESSGGSGGGGGGGGGGGQPGGGAQGEVETTNLSLLNTTVVTGAPVVTRVDLANFDPTAGQTTLRLAANGSVVTERTLSVGASSERTVYLVHRFGQPGRYVLGVDGTRVGTVTVTAAGTPTPTPTPTAASTDTPTATPPGTPTPTAADTPTGTAVPSTRSTTTGDGAGFGIVTVAVAFGLLLVRYTRH